MIQANYQKFKDKLIEIRGYIDDTTKQMLLLEKMNEKDKKQ
jgi:hypothetical protein